MSFSASVQADILQDALAPVSALVSECKVHLDATGWTITAVDPANVGMVDIEIDAGAFAAYSADGGVIGVSLERLGDVLSMADSDDMVQMELDEETRKLHIAIDGLEYTLALISPDTIRQEPDIPDLDLDGTYVATAAELGRAVTAADLCSDHIEVVGVDADELQFAAAGDTDDVEITVDGDRLISGQHSGDGAVASLFSLDYLDDMTTPMPSDAEVSLRVGQEFPVKLRYSLADGSVSVVNMLAPRVQSE